MSACGHLLSVAVYISVTVLAASVTEEDLCSMNVYMCIDDALCVVTGGESWECQCPEGSFGDGMKGANHTGCVYANYPCGNDDVCHSNGICSTQKLCACKPGFSGDGKDNCDDVNECKMGHCDENAICQNNPGSFKCVCNIGFDGDGFSCQPSCITSHDCQINGTLCDDTNHCVCTDGYHGNGFNNCTDINECELDTHGCGENADCVNTPGSYLCICSNGYHGNGFICSSTPRNCHDIKLSLGRRAKSGNHLIDPDGPGGLQAFNVRCEMRRQFGVTVFPSNMDKRYVTLRRAARVRRVIYPSSKKEMLAVTGTSQFCYQNVQYKCKTQIDLMSGDTWWLDGHRVKHYSWGAGNETGMCSCGQLNSCTDSMKTCNCDGTHVGHDDGKIYDKDILPIIKYHLSMKSNDKAYVKIGALKCGPFPFDFPKDCHEAKTSRHYKIKEDGPVVIDIDQEGPILPALVHCDMRSEKHTGITVIPHDRMFPEIPTGAGPNPLIYSVMMEVIKGVINDSYFCSQEVQYECKKSSLLGKGLSGGYIVDYKGDHMTYFAGGMQHSDMCACGLTQSCDLLSVNCNCDIMDDVTRKDFGIVTEKEKLPLGGLTLNDYGSEAWGRFTFGPLRCGRYQFGIKPTCEVLRATGHQDSYTYLIDPDGPITPGNEGQPNLEPFPVQCVMVAEPPHSITTIWHSSDGTYRLTSNDSTRVYVYQHVSRAQIIELKRSVSYCVQEVMYSCSQAPIHKRGGGSAYWHDINGDKQYYFSGQSGKGCVCGETGTCDGGGGYTCNCDLADGAVRIDTGVLTNTEQLPISEMHMIGVEGYADLQLGPLKCYETFPTCAHLNAHFKSLTKEEILNADYTVDPDGSSAIPAFRVTCQFPFLTVLPVFGNSSQKIVLAGQSAEEACFTISYGDHITPVQLQALVNVSSYCEQRVNYGCKNSPFTDHVSYKTCDHRTMYGWAYSQNTPGCGCGLMGTCSGGSGEKCNCDSNASYYQIDKGYITTLAALPVCEVCMKVDSLTAGVTSRLSRYTVSTLKCSSGSFGKRQSCQDVANRYKRVDSGIRMIDPDGRRREAPFTVQCIMTRYPTVGIIVIYPKITEVFIPEAGIDVSIDYFIISQKVLETVIRISQYCTQEVYIECTGNATLALHGNLGWYARDGTLQQYWIGNQNGTGCIGNVCNCDVSDGRDRIDGGLITDQNAIPISRVKLGPANGTRKLNIGPMKCYDIKPDCEAIRQARWPKNNRDLYTIDPDGAGGLDYFMAICDFKSYKKFAITQINVQTSAAGTVQGASDPGQFNQTITYEHSTYDHVNSLTRHSQFCYQGLSYDCQESPLINDNAPTYGSYTPFSSNTPSVNFGMGNDVNTIGCACVLSGTCPVNHTCHCDVKSPIAVTEYGFITARDSLPITSVAFGGQNSPNASALYSVTNVRCGPQIFDLPMDCQDAHGKGYLSGDVLIHPSSRIQPFFVYCDMNSLPGHGITVIGSQIDHSSPVHVVRFGHYLSVQYYNATIEQVSALSDVSSMCYMPIKFDCYAAQLLGGQSFFWIGKNGWQKQRYFRGGSATHAECSCGVDNMCGGDDGKFAQKRRKCNCDVADNAWRQDAGILKTHNLPVQSLHFAKAGFDQSRGVITLGNLYCSHQQFDLDECALGFHDCAEEAECINTFGSYLCRCKAGYRGWGRRPQNRFYATGRVCYDDDECYFGYCPHASDCNNYPGTYNCTCHAGYIQMDPYTCQDIDECKLDRHNCDVNARCVNTPGNYTCKCNYGYRGSGYHGECEEIAYCTCFGDPHCRSFDDRWLNFQGSCEYTMARDGCSGGIPTFEVLVQNWYRSSLLQDATWVKQIRINVAGITVELLQNLEIRVNGRKVHTPFKDAGISIQYRGGQFVEVYADVGLLIKWNGKTSVDVILPSGYRNKTCGLCGNYNHNPDDDWITGPACQTAGIITTSAHEFGHSWTNQNTAEKIEMCDLDCMAPANEDMCDNMSLDEVQLYCGRIFSAAGIFKDCLRRMPASAVQGFNQSCIFDLCHMRTELVFGMCTIAEALVKDCQTEYKVAVPDWRKPGFCAKVCAENMEYHKCGRPAQQVACQNITSVPVPYEECEEGCYCKTGYVLSGESCVTEDQCGCFYNMSYYSIGDSVITADCTMKHTCGSDNRMVTEALSCTIDEVCTLRDGVMGCHCKEGLLRENDTCIVDLCYNNTCLSDMVCMATPGAGYECLCSRGFTGSCSTCQDVNECATGTHKCDNKAVCVNTIGSYICICEEGFLAYGHLCQDIDECVLEIDDCPSNSKCFNTWGGYDCICCAGYTRASDGSCIGASALANKSECCACHGPGCKRVGQVCGTDGVTYDGEYDLIIAACVQGSTDLTVAYRHDCRSFCTQITCDVFKECVVDRLTGRPICQCESCTAADVQYMPVCTEAGDYFENMCDFKYVMCKNDKFTVVPITGEICKNIAAGPTTSWSGWDNCTATCGKGLRTRSRGFTAGATPTQKRILKMMQSEPCYGPPCQGGPCELHRCDTPGAECVADSLLLFHCECPVCAQPVVNDKICGLLGEHIATFSNDCKLRRMACLSGQPYQILHEGVCTGEPLACTLWHDLRNITESGCTSSVNVNIRRCLGTCGHQYDACCQSTLTSMTSVELMCPDGTAIIKDVSFVEACECVQSMPSFTEEQMTVT